MASPVDVVLLKLDRPRTCFSWGDHLSHSLILLQLNTDQFSVRFTFTWGRWNGVVGAALVSTVAVAEAGIEHCALSVRHQRASLRGSQVVLV